MNKLLNEINNRHGRHTMKIILTTILAMFSLSTFANNVEDFAKSQEFKQVKLSPDGKSIAVSLVNDDSSSIAFFDAKTLIPINKIGFDDKKEPGSFYWVNNERIVFKLMHRRAWSESPDYYGQLYAINKDGKRPKLIYGYNAGEVSAGPSAKKRKVSTRGWAEIIDLLKTDKKHILVQSTPYSGDGEVKPKAILLNVYTGIIKKTVTYSPVSSGDFFSDSSGNIKIVVGTNEQGEKLVYSYDSTIDEWKEFGSGKYGTGFTPLAISNNDKYFYVLDNFKQDKTGLYRINLDTQKRKLMFRDQSSDISYALLTSDNKNVLAIRFDPDYPNYALVPGKTEEHTIFRNMLATFPGQIVDVTSTTESGELSIVRVSGDVNPGVYYLYDSQSNNLRTLFKEFHI